MPSIFDGNEYLDPNELAILEQLNEQYTPQPVYSAPQPVYSAPQPVYSAPLPYNGRPVFNGTGYVGNVGNVPEVDPLVGYTGRPVFNGTGYTLDMNGVMQMPTNALPMARNPYSPFDPKPNPVTLLPSDVAGVPFIPQTGGEYRVFDSGPSKDSMLAQAVGMQANNLSPAQLQRLATINRQFDNSQSIANRNMSRYGTPALASYEQDLAIARATANADMLNRYGIDAPDAGGAAGGRSMGSGGNGSSGGSVGGGTRTPARPFGSGGDPLNTGSRTPATRPTAGVPATRPTAGVPATRPTAGVPATRPATGGGVTTNLSTALSGLTQLANFLIGKKDFTELQNMGLIKYIKGAFGNDKIIALRPDGSVAGTIAEANEDNPDTFSIAGGGYAVFGSDGMLRITNSNGELVDTLEGEPDEYSFDGNGNLVLTSVAEPDLVEDDYTNNEPDLNENDYTDSVSPYTPLPDPYEVDQMPYIPPDVYEIPEVELPELELEPPDLELPPLDFGF